MKEKEISNLSDTNITYMSGSITALVK
jgi:hypothetical protein